MKNALFVQANVAVNAKLTSKVPFLFGNFDVFKNNLVKKANFGVCPFQYPKVHLEAGAPPKKNILMLPTPLFISLLWHCLHIL